MPTSSAGYTRDELITNVMSIIGSNNIALQSYLINQISALQNEFYQLHDWSFAHNSPRSAPTTFSTVVGQRAYDLLTLGLNIVTPNIASIVCITANQGFSLINTTLESVRVNDPSGIVVGAPTFWFPVTMTQIELWPVPNVVLQYVVEGKQESTYISDPSNIALSIPYRYQGCFQQYVLIHAMQYERDPRYADEFKVFQMKLQAAIREDMRLLETNLRMLTSNEVLASPGAYDLNQRLWYTGDY